jgi:hypothetical protein
MVATTVHILSYLFCPQYSVLRIFDPFALISLALHYNKHRPLCCFIYRCVRGIGLLSLRVIQRHCGVLMLMRDAAPRQPLRVPCAPAYFTRMFMNVRATARNEFIKERDVAAIKQSQGRLWWWSRRLEWR